MGLFDKLFAKKECSICGGEIGLLGNRKLEDGNLCKDCAKKLSPFFSDRRESTVAQIQEQLAYREANKDAVAAFNATRVIDCDNETLYFDEDKKQFVIANGGNNWRNDNPDVISYSQVTGCDVEVDESKDEITYKNKEGQSVSYNPPRYKYYYNFELIIHVNSPYFSRLRVQTNNNSVEGRGMAYNQELKKAEEIKSLFNKVHQEEREAVVQAAAPKTPVVCPACGATTLPDANGCCEYCGSPV